jgi:hypothetical protein
MKAQFCTDLPFGYDEQTTMALNENNEVTITHPILQPMIYDQTVMRWVPIAITERT